MEKKGRHTTEIKSSIIQDNPHTEIKVNLKTSVFKEKAKNS